MITDSIYRRTHFYAGNIFRFITIPFFQTIIKPDEARTIFGASFGDNGWHHIISTLEEYDTNNDINYNETNLYRFLKLFTPSSICDLLNNNDKKIENLPLFIYPWGTFKKKIIDTNKTPRLSRFCGPSDDSFIKNEFSRTIKLYNNIKNNGYKPWKAYNGFIGGTILEKDNGERRFIVLQGNHRLAILCHLGVEKIKVRVLPGNIKIFKENSLKNSPLVLNGSCDYDTAISIFNLFFYEDGNHLLKHLK